MNLIDKQKAKAEKLYDNLDIDAPEYGQVLISLDELQAEIHKRIGELDKDIKKMERVSIVIDKKLRMGTESCRDYTAIVFRFNKKKQLEFDYFWNNEIAGGHSSEGIDIPRNKAKELYKLLKGEFENGKQ
jgi:hypothetical protein